MRQNYRSCKNLRSRVQGHIIQMEAYFKKLYAVQLTQKTLYELHKHQSIPPKLINHCELAKRGQV